MGAPATRVAFSKMEGCGNDYLLVDGAARAFPISQAGALARRWSDRHFGVGADGLILLTREPDGALRMSMWNADGSRGAMCGNGLRCFARFAAANGYAETAQFVVQTDAGPREVELLGTDLVRAAMGEVQVTSPRFVDVAGRRLEFVLGDAGNPHAVTFVEDVDAAPVHEVGAAMQAHAAFPGGVNVEFVQVTGADRIRQRTFERGSGETLACGTGAAVAALAARQSGNIRGAATHVGLRGGTLTVVGAGASLAIEGPARTVFCGEVDLPASL